MLIEMLYVGRESFDEPKAGDQIYSRSVEDRLSNVPGSKLNFIFGGSRLSGSVGERSSQVRLSGGLKWEILLSIFTSLPKAAVLAFGASQKHRFLESFRRVSPDIVFFDSCSCGRAFIWVHEELRRTSNQKRPQLIYVSHNVESKVRREAALSQSSAIKRLLYWFDAVKYASLERKLIDGCDFVTTISEDDSKQFQSLSKRRLNLICVPPVFTGYMAEDFQPPKDKHKVVLIGSFLWHIKRRNLEECLDSFARAVGAGLARQLTFVVAGKMTESYHNYLVKTFPQVQFIRDFNHSRDILHDARLALCVERIGGGLKLKALDYAFGRVPMIAFPWAVRGTYLRPGLDYVPCESSDEAWQIADRLCSNASELIRLQESARETVTKHFLSGTQISDLVSMSAAKI